MKMKKWLAVFLAVCLLSTLAGCGGKGTAVYVQSVRDIIGVSAVGLNDRYPGVVVSENVTEIQKDQDKAVAELFVKEGEDVTAGQSLFAYDSDELQLTLDKQKLELEQLQAQLVNFKDQITTLEKEKGKAPSSEQLQYTVQIQSLQVEQKETELNIAAKQKEIESSQAILNNAVVMAPVDGRIQSINENGMDNYGNPLAYITIQQAGAYRIKGSLGELQRGAIMEGARLKIVSRQNENVFWMGTVVLVDYENATQDNSNNMWSSPDGMSNSSKYPFYVELDSAEDLMLGQHVYLTAETGDEETGGLRLPEYFICREEGEGAYVWAEGKGGKLEKREVTLGLYDEGMCTYEIQEGLSLEDYIAYPDEELCHAGAPTTHEQAELEEGEQPEGGFADGGFVDGGFVDGGGFVDDGGFVDNGGFMEDGGFTDDGGFVEENFSEEGADLASEPMEG